MDTPLTTPTDDLGLPSLSTVAATSDPKVLAGYHLALATGIPYQDALDVVYALTNVARGLRKTGPHVRRAKPDPKEGQL